MNYNILNHMTSLPLRWHCSGVTICHQGNGTVVVWLSILTFHYHHNYLNVLTLKLLIILEHTQGDSLYQAVALQCIRKDLNIAQCTNMYNVRRIIGSTSSKDRKLLIKIFVCSSVWICERFFWPKTVCQENQHVLSRWLNALARICRCYKIVLSITLILLT